MAIEVIVNGFYRSGTTMIWDILKKSNINKKIFYEPLNPYLMYYIKLEAFSHKPNPLHNMLLFQEYIETGPRLIEKISSKQPMFNQAFPEDRNKLFEYLDIFQDVDNSILQVNRLHFHLTDIHNLYNAKLIHIIRNPFDVYKSIVVDFYKNHYHSKWKLKYFIQYKLRKKYYLHFDHFDIRTMYEFIQKKYGYGIDSLIAIDDDSFKYFLVDWIVCNYYAMRSIEEARGLLLTYEEIIVDSEKALNKIYQYTNLKVDGSDINNKHKYMYDYKKKYDLSKYTRNSMLDEMSQYIFGKL